MFYGSPCKLKICNFDIMRTFRLGVFLGERFCPAPVFHCLSSVLYVFPPVRMIWNVTKRPQVSLLPRRYRPAGGHWHVP